MEGNKTDHSLISRPTLQLEDIVRRPAQQITGFGKVIYCAIRYVLGYHYEKGVRIWRKRYAVLFETNRNDRVRVPKA